VGFYFDHREGREKPIPDCSKVGCVWNSQSQRCERAPWIERLLMNLSWGKNTGGNQGLGFLFDDFSFDFSSSSGGGGWDFWNIFDVAIESGFAEDIALQIANGWYGDPADIFGPDFDPIITSEPGGLPPVPVNPPLVILSPDGVPGPDPNIFAPDIDEDIAQPPYPRLPGYCGSGTYHPANDPYSCVPFPADPTARRKAQQSKATQGKTQQKRQTANAQPCPTGQARWPYTSKCVPQQCASGTQRNRATGACDRATSQQRATNNARSAQCPSGKVLNSKTRKCVTPGETGDEYSILIWLLLGAVGLYAVAKR